MDHDVAKELVDAGRGYEALFVPALFEPWTRHLTDGAGVGEGSHVLDVACGTGVLARRALAETGTSGRVVGADPAPGMLAVAEEIEPGIEWILCPAEALDADDGTFDAVASQFGMMFFEDRHTAMKEMFRVLKPGGRVAIAVWRSLEYNPAYADIGSLLDRQVGTAAGDALRLPFSLGDPHLVASALESAGFIDIAVAALAESATFPNAQHMLEAELRGWLPLFDIFLDEEKINEVLAASAKTLGKYAGPGGKAVFPMSAHVFTAGKP